MKNKAIRTLTAFCAALLLTGGVSTTAFAQSPDANATNDTGVIVEETENTPPLTPEGNATLVDDFGGNKQLITITTKAGNYFYILIDRAAEGENTVHFLNQVDDADLDALLEDGESKEETPAVCNCSEKCEAGAVNTACPVCSLDRTKCIGKEAAPEPEETEPEEETGGGMGGLALVLLVSLLGGGGAFYYLKVMKPKKDAVKGSDALEDYDFDDYEDEEAGDRQDSEAADEEEQEDDDV